MQTLRKTSIRRWRRALPRGLIVVGVLVLLAACDRASGSAVAVSDAHPAAIMPSAANRAASDYVDSVVGDELFETRTAAIAASRATDPDVKAYARLMARDYAASRADMTQAIAASAQDIAPPVVMSDHLQSMLDELGQGSGPNFDKTYIDQQIEAQEETLGLTSAYAEGGAAPSIKAAAGRLAPQIQAHLDQARAIEDALNKKL